MAAPHVFGTARLRVLAAALGFASSSVGLGSGALFSPRAAFAYPETNITLAGHGFGHGKGMGQWGALGYALAGTTYQQILAHYYGTLSDGSATKVGPLASPASDTATQITVAISENFGQDVIVTSNSPFTVPGPNATTVNLPSGSGALFRMEHPGATPAWDVYTSPSGCGGGGNWGSPEVTGIMNPTAAPVVPAPFPADTNLSNEVLQLCRLGGNISVRGSIEATPNSDDAPRTVNLLPLGQYVADVTPAESPTSWGSLGATDAAGQAGPQGQDWGFQALEAQAVAARSYVMSTYGNLQGYYGYADICDTTLCQEYPGISDENTLADSATTDTVSTVVLMANGMPAFTQYSSSTGGYTDSGNFLPVVDTGDAICDSDACNSHHNWSAQVTVSSIEAAYPNIGSLMSLSVTQRNGYGDYGGRVMQMSLVGSAQSLVITGNDFVSSLGGHGVQSNWFTIESDPSGGESGYWSVGSDGGVFAFGSAVYSGSLPAVGVHVDNVRAMAATSDQKGYWLVASDGGVFGFGSAHFYGSLPGLGVYVDDILGMAPAADGKGYLLVGADGGVFTFGSAHFYGSLPGKGTHVKDVTSLAPTPDSKGYWLAGGDGSVYNFGDATNYGSLPALRVNVNDIVAIAPTPDAKGYWLLGADGGIFAFGDAQYLGSLTGSHVNAYAVALLPTKTGNGYLIDTFDGRSVAYGDSPQFGDVASAVPGFGGTIVGGAFAAQ